MKVHTAGTQIMWLYAHHAVNGTHMELETPGVRVWRQIHASRAAVQLTAIHSANCINVQASNGATHRYKIK